MFQFTRELIINGLDGKLKAVGAGAVQVTLPEGSNGKLGVASYTEGPRTGAKELLIDNFINIPAESIKAATYHLPKEAVNEKVTVTLPDLTDKVKKGDVVRLVVTLGQEGRVISTYNDQYPDHSNRIFVEALVDAVDAKAVVAALVANAKAADKRFESCLAKLTDASDTAAKLVIEAVDEFTRVKEIKIVKVGSDKQTSALLTGYGDHEEILKVIRKDFDTNTAVAVVYGDLGCGTTNILVRNNRILTAAHTDPFSTHGDERPVPGGKYTQFNIEVVTKRNQIGHQVFGSVGDESLCTVILFALGDADAEAPSVAKVVKAAITTTKEAPKKF